MDVNDRGTKKWTSLMLPEHVELLKDVFKEEKEKPILDEQQIIQNNLLLQEALENDIEIKIMYFAEQDYKETTGFLLNIDVLNKRIFLEDKQLNFDDVIVVELL